MDWLKKHFDRVILAALGAILIAFAGIIISNVLSFNETLTARDSARPPNNNVPPPPTELVKERLEHIGKPRGWSVHDGSLFLSEPYVSKDGGPPINPLKDEEPLYPPITNKWIEQYHLDFSRSNLPNEDPDADKFSNVEEFIGKTDPTDPKSIPAYFTKLRLLEFIQVPFRLKFSGSPDAGIYTINTLDLKSPTQFLPLGATIAGTPYKLVKYDAKTINENDMEKNVSVLTIENQETAQKIQLIYDKAVNDPTVFAKFKYLWDGSEFKVKKNDHFSIKPEAKVKYKLIDISDAEAVIENPQGARITVPKGDF